MDCPKCGSNKAYRNGGNILKRGVKVQRYYCPSCGKSFQLPTKGSNDDED